MLCQASEIRMGEAEEREIEKKKDRVKRRRGREMKRYMSDRDVKRSGEMSGGGGCSVGSISAAFTCSTTHLPPPPPPPPPPTLPLRPH